MKFVEIDLLGVYRSRFDALQNANGRRRRMLRPRRSRTVKYVDDCTSAKSAAFRGSEQAILPAQTGTERGVACRQCYGPILAVKTFRQSRIMSAKGSGSWSGSGADKPLWC